MMPISHEGEKQNNLLEEVWRNILLVGLGQATGSTADASHLLRRDTGGTGVSEPVSPSCLPCTQVLNGQKHWPGCDGVAQ